MDLGEFFSSRENQTALLKFLQSQGLETHSWWKMSGTANGHSIAIGSLWTGVGFNASEISIRDEEKQHPGNAYNRWKSQVDKAYGLSFMFVGQQIQAGIIKTLADAGLNPRDFKQLEGAAIEIRADLSPTPAQVNTLLKETVRVQVALDGTTRLITENGTVEVGKKKLQLFMALLGQRSGMTVTPSGEFESHRHDEDQVRQRLDAWQ
jgi:hypothetical protein